jgi:hypothetical protein
MEHRGGGKGKESNGQAVLKFFTYKQKENVTICNESCQIMGVRRKGEGRVTEEVELTKIKYIHSCYTLRNPFEH